MARKRAPFTFIHCQYSPSHRRRFLEIRIQNYNNWKGYIECNVPDPEYCRRTARTRLDVDGQAHEALLAVIGEWKRGCQLAVERAWGVCHTRSDVQSLAYDEVRERTDLGSQHAVLATHEAAEAIKRAQETDGSKPQFTRPTVVYDTRTLTVFDDDTVSLTTTDDRIRCDLAVSADAYQRRYLDDPNDEGWEPTTSTLHCRDGSFVLHLGFRKPAPEQQQGTDDATGDEGDDDPEAGKVVLGVAFGEANLAVTSTARFFPGGALSHRHRENTATLRALREKAGRNADRTYRRVAGRQERFVRDELHHVANGIVKEATTNDCDLVAFGQIPDVLEELPGAGRFHERTFQSLFEIAEYKAEARGIEVVAVNPEYTRQRCTDCGFTHPENVDVETHHFACLKCGREGQADYNAAKNVGFRCIRRGPLSSKVGAAHCALKSGLVTPDGDFESYEESGQSLVFDRRGSG